RRNEVGGREHETLFECRQRARREPAGGPARPGPPRSRPRARGHRRDAPRTWPRQPGQADDEKREIHCGLLAWKTGRDESAARTFSPNCPGTTGRATAAYLCSWSGPEPDDVGTTRAPVAIAVEEVTVDVQESR